MIVYLGTGVQDVDLIRHEVDGFEGFYNDLIKEPVLDNPGPYFISASRVKLLKRRNANVMSTWFVALDLDKNAPSINTLKEVLEKLKINHLLYTTKSHLPETPRYRVVIPCKIDGNPENTYRTTTRHLVAKIREHIVGFMPDTASEKLSQLWFLPIKSIYFESYIYNKGVDYEAIEGEPDAQPKIDAEEKSTVNEIVGTIVAGEAPLHDTIGKYIFGAIRDGRQPAEIKATLHGLTIAYDLKDKRLRQRKEDIDRRVEAYRLKRDRELDVNIAMPDETRIFTKVPKQVGVVEDLIQYCEASMYNPNRQIAFVAAFGILSALCGRVYYYEPTGAGVTWCCQLTGRSTIGKGHVGKIFSRFLNGDNVGNIANQFYGGSWYTSPKNLIDDIKSHTSLFALLSESGLSGQSALGDMTRYLSAVLNIMVASGPNKSYVPGVQNEKMPTLYSPAMTLIKESTEEAQKIADRVNKSAATGEAGRLNHVLIDPHKESQIINFNFEREPIPDHLMALRSNLLEKAVKHERGDCTKPLPLDMWIPVTVGDFGYVQNKLHEFIEMENDAAKNLDNFSASFYGRLHEKLPAVAALAAIANDPDNPVITNEIVDVAIETLIEQVKAFIRQEKSGVLDAGWIFVVNRIKSLFAGDLTKKKMLTRHCKTKMLKEGCCDWSTISKNISSYAQFRELKSKVGSFSFNLEQHLKMEGIRKLDPEEAKRRFQTTAAVFTRR